MSVDKEKVDAFLNQLEEFNVLDSEFIKLYDLFNRLTPKDKFRFEQTYCEEEHECEQYDKCRIMYESEEDSEMLAQFLKILNNTNLDFESSCKMFFIYETQLNDLEKKQILFNAFKNGRAGLILIFFENNGNIYGL